MTDELDTIGPKGAAGHRGVLAPHWPPPPDPALVSEYEECLLVARHYENFPVASRLLPPSCRPHLAAIYAFARAADDLADEPEPVLGGVGIGTDRESRLRALDRWEAGLNGDPPPGAEGLFRALAATRRDCRLPDGPLRNLLTAFRWDVERVGFESWAELRRYADHSAAPIGRLVLAVAGGDESRLGSACDDLCVALQYTNFWQDLSVDWPRGRLYLPEQSWRTPSVSRARLDGLARARMLDPATLPTAVFEALESGLDEAIRQTEELYENTARLPRAAGAGLALYLGAVWEGGHRVLQQTRRAGRAVFVQRPRLSRWQRILTLWRAYRSTRGYR